MEDNQNPAGQETLDSIYQLKIKPWHKGVPLDMAKLPDPEDVLEQVDSKETFIAFVMCLAANLEKDPDDWQNTGLFEYLESIASWSDGIERYYERLGEPMPLNVNWRVFGEILMAGKVYE